jgi:3-phosphoshikimate 1-carboxyvinyltransferase
MDKQITHTAEIGGTIKVPGDKSISHRALLIGALCNGPVTITNLSTAADCISTRRCLEALGVIIESVNRRAVVVQGRGRYGFCEPSGVLDAGNSGTTMRLLSGLLSGQAFVSIITGDDSLRSRPMGRIIEPLQKMGARIMARKNGTRAPLAISGGGLQSIDYTMPVASAQVKSAILLAGLFCTETTSITERTPSRDHTERMLQYLGGRIAVDNNRISIEGSELAAADLTIPGDISSAFYFLLAGVLAGGSDVRVEQVGLNPTRLGGITALQNMGADIRIVQTGECNHEPYGRIDAYPSRLQGIKITPEMIPSLVDEVPALTLAATQAEGKTIITGAKELRFKESDRLQTVATELSRMGGSIIQREDGLEITGPSPLRGAFAKSYHDHRLAMTLGVAGLIAAGETVISHAEAIEVSYPEFFATLEKLTG